MLRRMARRVYVGSRALLAWLETRAGFSLVLAVLTGLGAALRAFRLSVPAERVFDEVYSPTFAWKFLHSEAFFDVHPILAQLPHVLGLQLFRDTPLGWRFGPWLWGSLFTVGLSLAACFLTGRRTVGLLAGALASLDIAFFVYSRTGLPDMFLLAVFAWSLALFFLSCRTEKRTVATTAVLGSGILLGSLPAVKWFGIGTLALVWVWIGFAARARRSPSPPRPNVPLGMLPVVLLLVPVLTYLLWTVPLVGIPGTVRPAVGDDLFRTPCTFGPTPNPAAQPPATWWGRVVHWHCTVWNYHTYLTATHPYGSPWWSWPILRHPVLFYLDSADSHRRISATGNPVLWWTAFATAWLTLLSLPVRWRRTRLIAGGEGAGTRSWPGPLLTDLWLLLGIFGFWLPWALITRVTFHYHYFLSFTLSLLLLARWLGFFLDRPLLRPVALGFLLLVLGAFAVSYPSATALSAFWIQ